MTPRMSLTCKHCQMSFATEAARPECPSCGGMLEAESLAFIADSDRPFRTLMADELRRLGFRVEVFSHGAGLLDSVRAERPALLRANVYLSGMLGVEICEQVKEDETLPTKVLLIGAIFRPDRYKARPTSLYGADGYCEEGLSSEAFSAVVRKALEPARDSVALSGESEQR